MTGAAEGGGLDRAGRRSALALAKRAAARARHHNSTVSIHRNQQLADLPEFRASRALRQIRQGLAIEDPYHRLHSGRATAVSNVDGRDCLNFSSYDYLGLNADPRPVAAACRAMARYGVSATASRMVAGERPAHRDLEAALAANYEAEAALAFVSGHATNVSVIGALVRDGDAIVHDSFIHNSVTVGARLSTATRRSFPHGDMDALEAMLEEMRPQFRNVLVVVEGLYSMDGDLPDLTRLAALKRRFGIWLMIDEAHALGCAGPTGRGSFEQVGVDPGEIDIWMGTMSKTLASTGGYIAGSADLIEFLRYNSDGFVFSVALPPALAAAAECALGLMRREPDRVAQLQANGRHFLARAGELELNTGLSSGFGVVPVIVGDSALAAKLSERLFARGINVAPVTFPGVPMQSARLRFFLSASHTHEQLDRGLAAVREELDRLTRDGFAERIAQHLSAIGRGRGGSEKDDPPRRGEARPTWREAGP